MPFRYNASTRSRYGLSHRLGLDHNAPIALDILEHRKRDSKNISTTEDAVIIFAVSPPSF